MRKKYVYFFDEGNAEMRDLLGGKGANLCEMTRIGLPVPPGFVISTEACIHYFENGKKFPEELWDQVMAALARVELETGKKFGDEERPLLVSVRSGAKVSMPGMMDTVLNLGLNDETVETLSRIAGNQRFAYDCYRRFMQMFGNVVMEVKKDLFEHALSDLKDKKGYKYDTELTPVDLRELVDIFKGIVKKESGQEFPSQPLKQLEMAIRAVFESWYNPRAITYRKINEIPETLGTAVNVQTMVFGNMGENSGTGVAFTRDPSTGEKKLYGEYLLNAQGEDVVAGIRTPQPLEKLKDELLEAYDKLAGIMDTLEQHYRDTQDLEFTIEEGKLYMLQTRVGKRTAAAALKIAVDMVEEGLIDKKTAVMRIDPSQLDQLLHPRIDPNADFQVLTKGLNASPGAATGKVVFHADTAEEMGKAGEMVILVRWETTPDDIHGLVQSQGILTSHGGMTSHAAVVARGMGKPCVCGAEEVKIDYASKSCRVKDVVIREGDIITIDGTTGRVILGEVPLIPPMINEDFRRLLAWADEIRKLGVRANADTPEDAAKSRDFEAEGIGLCRTEHMFMAEDRLPHVQAAILAKTDEERAKPLQKLLKMQKEDFAAILKAMNGLPVTIRLLDPPLHEFLPNLGDLRVEVAELKHRGASLEELAAKEELLANVRTLSEANPMLGLRGCRLGITRPDIYQMQVRAIFEAACDVVEEGYEPVVEVMIPLVGIDKELALLKESTEKVIHQVFEERGIRIGYKIGTMIELPRAALTADEIAEHAEFFSFGTNDLTQTTFGFSRDDAEGKFIPEYVELGILEKNPFEVLDTEGVGKLIDMAVKLSRQVRPDIKLGVCGEHGGEPKSIKFCHQVGLTYVSCSPFRVPLARLAAAQAVVEEEREVFIDK
ncbi:pyruvate, orthophosphate dikinase [Candidatus Hakubella thermalkaliphila]|uniref:Pyruvate, phosphate dikinase n=1 Tax=Candidatus Hakubella thermalkaliphila TaxID=2754717 RepID=A0A6V8PI09_9ACTN|nr:pyruvate, orthophosphate dikinase [Candidatus Hakubella thermalkaliphila]